jgi:hypothetical protein
LFVLATLSALVALCVQGVSYAGDVPPPNANSIDKISFQVTWTKGGTPTIQTFVGDPPALPSAPTGARTASASACNGTIASPGKSGSTIYDTNTTTCTTDVDYVGSTLYLWRGLSSPHLIGSDAESNSGYYVFNYASGPCASSTWAYYGTVTVVAHSVVNGSYGPVSFRGPTHYWSC